MAPEFVLTDFAKMERPGQLHLGYIVSCVTTIKCVHLHVTMWLMAVIPTLFK